MRKIVIIGGGLAGLTAAYYLSKNQGFEIELYEANATLGGRVQAAEVDGFHFDYGAFMIFPWYKSFHKLLNSLNVGHATEPIHFNKEYSWDEDTLSFHRINDNWALDDVTISTFLKTLPDIFSHETQLYNPDLSRFNHMTVEQYVKQQNPDDTRALDMINKLLVGYTYGSISRLPMSIYFGFAKEILLHNGFKHVTMLQAGTNSLIDTLEEKLKQQAVKINISSKITIDQKKNLTFGARKLDYDYAVIASSHDNLTNVFTPSLENPITYNDHYAALLHTSNKVTVNGNEDWNLVYTASMDETTSQLTCIANVPNIFPNGPSRTYITYLRVPEESRHKFNMITAKREILSQFSKYFLDAGDVDLKFMHHWDKTMPIVSIEALSKLQSIQGKDKIYFAGDYMGAPSMEVAVQSGEKVAELITESIKIQKTNL